MERFARHSLALITFLFMLGIVTSTAARPQSAVPATPPMACHAASVTYSSDYSADIATPGISISLSPVVSKTLRRRPLVLNDPPDAQSTTGPMPPPGASLQSSPLTPQDATIIPEVPAYLWHHGCGPTAAGMLIGYWDTRGFDALVPGDPHTQTAAVNSIIASEGSASNYTDYCEPLDDPATNPSPLPDKSESPPGDEHLDNCIADYMKTSQSYHGNYYGWSWFSQVGIGMRNYVSSLAQSGYYATTDNLYYGSPRLNWDWFRAEIDSGRPVVLLVDTDGNRVTDHFVTAIGYGVVNGIQMYACLDTWYTDIRWCEFAPIALGQSWGIWGAVTFRIYASPADVVIDGPTATIAQTSTVLTATVSPITTTQPITYVWQTRGQSPVTHTDGLSNTAHLTWSMPGTQTITVTAMNPAGVVSNTHFITVYTPVNADFAASPTSGIVPLTVHFTNTSSGDYTSSLWDFGDRFVSTQTNASHAYTVTGEYTVTLTTSGPGGSDTETKAEHITVQYGIYLPLALRNP